MAQVIVLFIDCDCLASATESKNGKNKETSVKNARFVAPHHGVKIGESQRASAQPALKGDGRRNCDEQFLGHITALTNQVDSECIAVRCIPK